MMSILLINAAPATRTLVARLLQESTGHATVWADSEQEVLRVIREEAPEAILLQPSGDGLDGPELVRAIHSRNSTIPIILITIQGHESAAIRAFSYGAANYVPRRLLKAELIPTLRTVLQAARHKQREQQLFEYLTELHCRFELENERALLPLVVSYLQNHLSRLRLCNEASLIRAGIAIDEALVNALYHGNLELDSALRETDAAEYERLGLERARQRPYCDRRIRVTAHISTDLAEITVCDEGPGFDPHSLPDPTDPANMDKVSGRGVHLMRSFMDEVRYNETGNCVSLILRSQRCAHA